MAQKGYPQTTPYQSLKQKYYEDLPALYLHDDPCPRKKVIKITHIAGRFVNCATTEYIIIGYWNGTEYIELYKGAPAVTSDWVHWNGEIYLREGQYAYGYYANLASGERKELTVDGKFEP